MFLRQYCGTIDRIPTYLSMYKLREGLSFFNDWIENLKTDFLTHRNGSFGNTQKGTVEKVKKMCGLCDLLKY